MNLYDFDQMTREIKAKLDKYNEHIDWLAANRDNSSPSAKPQQQTKTEKSNSVANLSSQDFMKAYKKNADELQNQVFKELGIEPQQKKSNYQVEQPQSNFAIVNLPSRFSSQEVLARTKKGENLADILAELSKPE